MEITKLPVAGALLGLSLLTACRSSSNNTPDATTDTGGGIIHIQDVQSDTMAPGTAVELRGVIVTALDAYGTQTGNLWVEEPGGGPFSGVHVFGTPVAQLSGIAVGDIVDITGAIKSEFAISSDKSGRTVTEVQGPSGGKLTLTKKGKGTVPAPAVVDVLAIGQKATQALRDAEWEKWEGVLITASNVVAFGNPACITSQGNCTDPTRTNLTITGVAKLESSLTAFPAPGIQLGDCLGKVTGVVDYAFDYVIFPRSVDDVALNGTGCVRETGATANFCTDGLDNDGNGFNDCKDFGCEVGPNAWLGASCTAGDAMCGCSMNLPEGMSVNKVNTGTVGPVVLNNVYVTAVGARGYWIADSTTAATSGGVLVFTNVAPTATVGQQLSRVQGIAGPFNASKTAAGTVIELSNPTAGTELSTGATFTPITTASAATLAGLTTGAPYAGSLVQLQTVKVKAVTGTKVTLVDNANAQIVMTDGAFAAYTGAVPAVNDCYVTLTGVMDFNTADPQTRTINPRAIADMVKGTGCTGN